MQPPIGQLTAIQLLTSAIAHQTHYNFLIHGPEGIGKAALARWAASLFLGADQLSGHPDLLEIMPTIKEGKELVPSPDGIIRMEQLRSEVLDLQPVLASHRVVIIHHAHQGGQNFNALLKAMEERLVFILVTDQPQLLLETVRSRCLSVPCTKLNAVDMVQVLATHSPQTLEMEWLLSMVPGQPGQAITLHQHLSTVGAELLGRIEGAVAGAPEHDRMVLAGVIAALDKPIQMSLLAVVEYLGWQATHNPEVLQFIRTAQSQISTIKQTQLPWYLLLCKLTACDICIPLVELPPAPTVPAPEPEVPRGRKQKSSATAKPRKGSLEGTAAGTKTSKKGKAAQVDLLRL